MLNAMVGVDGQHPTGLRMAGKYSGSGGSSVDFTPEGAIVSCGEVGKVGAYAVGFNGNQVQIAIQQDVKPVVVTFRPDGTLLGTGAIQVNGRVATGRLPNDEIAYTPRIATCTLGTLAAGSGASTAAGSPSTTSSAAVVATWRLHRPPSPSLCRTRMARPNCPR